MHSSKPRLPGNKSSIYKIIQRVMACIIFTAITACGIQRETDVIQLGGKIASQASLHAKEGAAPASMANLSSAHQQISDALDFMRLDNEVIPHGVPDSMGWKRRPEQVMGTEPYASALPKWWPGIHFPEWHWITPWFVIFEASTGHHATNTAVEVNGIEMWALLDSSKTWVKITSGASPTWFHGYPENDLSMKGTRPASGRAAANGGVFLFPGNGMAIHGGLKIMPTPWVNDHGDLLAVFVSLRHRLAVINPDGPDDRSAAAFAVHAGADFWPCPGGCSKTLGADYLPGLGWGRFIKSSTQWRHATFIAVKNGMTREQLLQYPAPSLEY